MIPQEQWRIVKHADFLSILAREVWRIDSIRLANIIAEPSVKINNGSAIEELTLRATIKLIALEGGWKEVSAEHSFVWDAIPTLNEVQNQCKTIATSLADAIVEYDHYKELNTRFENS